MNKNRGITDEKSYNERMNTDTRLAENYKKAFDEIHASSQLLRKVKDMNKKEVNKKLRWAGRFGYVAAAIAAVGFISSNAIVYAATGDTWVHKAVVIINGEEKKVDLVKKTDKDGNEIYEGTFVDESDQSIYLAEDSYDKNELGGGGFVAINGDLSETASLEKENDRVYLVAGDVRVDITEDIADGKCTGTFEHNNMNFEYEITGNIEMHNINIWVVD